jgi:hypothetical protein
MLHQLEIKCVSLTRDDETIVVSQIVAARNVSPVQTAEYLCSLLITELLFTTNLSVEHGVRVKAIASDHYWIRLDCVHSDIAMARRLVNPLHLRVGVRLHRRIAPSYIGKGLEMCLILRILPVGYV